MLIDRPSPTFHNNPYSNNSLALQMLLHTKDARGPILASVKVEEGWYLACKIREIRESGFCKILHPCFAKMALLKMTKSLNPRPPATFDLLILS
jgi:hypothetical protein